MEYEIIGDNLQMVVTKISSGEMVYGEAGAMIYMSDNMQTNAKAKGGFLKGISPLSIGGLPGDRNKKLGGDK
ncbi:MAG: AIM24 family protein [Halobacteriota archaeon]